VKNIILICLVVTIAGGFFLLACQIPGNWLEKNFDGRSKLPLWNEKRPFKYHNGLLDIRYMGLILRVDMTTGIPRCTLIDISNKLACQFGGEGKAFHISQIDGPDGGDVVSVQYG
jgi:hypothetical protein